MEINGQQHFEFYAEVCDQDGEGEARSERHAEPEDSTAPKNPDPKTMCLMEKIVEKANLKKALKRVQTNKGAAGTDGMKVEDLHPYLLEHWPKLESELLAGSYKPSSIKRVEIPKTGGGKRLLGIPTVLDRFIQQAVLQVLTPIYDPTFSERSYGFRPGKDAHQAVQSAKEYIAEGYSWVVDLDIEKFFDRVNHDILMGRIAKRIADKRLLKLLRLYLQAGVMVHGVVVDRHEGTPQGGPLSPLLSNILLDELDKELEERGHKFSRYADDCNIYVKSERAGKRVMDSVKSFLQRRLRLKVNEEKSAVTPAGVRKFLGFGFWFKKGVKIGIAKESVKKAKARIRFITKRSRGLSLETVIGRLNRFTLGWVAYFRISEGRSTLESMDTWTRRRLRCFKIKQWKKRSRTRFRELTKLGLGKDAAATFASSRKGWWKLSMTPQLSMAMPPSYFRNLGLIDALGRYRQLQSV